jgi:hypothetical protein
MRRRIGLSFLPFLLILLVGQRTPAQPQTHLILTHVTVIDASGAPPQYDMAVVITGDRIAEMGKFGKVHVPKNAEVVDETGKFLIPRLWDMHVHWYAKKYLPLFIANGVTGIRLMWGQSTHHQWRKEIEQGTLLGSRMVIASPIVDGPNPFWPGSIGVANEEDARLVVAREPGCVINSSASGRLLASCPTAAVNSSMVGFMRSNSSNNSCRRRPAQRASVSYVCLFLSRALDNLQWLEPPVPLPRQQVRAT